MTDFQLACMKTAKKQWKAEHDKSKKKELIEKKWRETSLCYTCKERDSCKHGKRREYGYIIIDCTTYSKESKK